MALGMLWNSSNKFCKIHANSSTHYQIQTNHQNLTFLRWYQANPKEVDNSLLPSSFCSLCITTNDNVKWFTNICFSSIFLKNMVFFLSNKILEIFISPYFPNKHRDQHININIIQYNTIQLCIILVYLMWLVYFPISHITHSISKH